MSVKSYRITFFDKNGIRPNIEFVESGENLPKYAAIEAATTELHARAEKDIRLITNGMSGTYHKVTTNKGEEISVRTLQVSPEYYQHLVDECWGIADVMQIQGVGKTVSSEKTVETTAEKAQPTKRRRRWSKAQKRAAKAARTINGKPADTTVKVSHDDSVKLAVA